MWFRIGGKGDGGGNHPIILYGWCVLYRGTVLLTALGRSGVDRGSGDNPKFAGGTGGLIGGGHDLLDAEDAQSGPGLASISPSFSRLRVPEAQSLLG